MGPHVSLDVLAKKSPPCEFPSGGALDPAPPSGFLLEIRWKSMSRGFAAGRPNPHPDRHIEARRFALGTYSKKAPSGPYPSRAQPPDSERRRICRAWRSSDL